MPVRSLLQHLLQPRDLLLLPGNPVVASGDTVLPAGMRAEVVQILAGILLHSCQESQL